MTLLELQDVLGERIKATMESSDMPAWKRHAEYKRTSTIIELAKQMTNVADDVIRAEKLYADTVKSKSPIRAYHSYSLINGGK